MEIPVAPNRECVEILIGQSDKALLTVLQDHKDKDPNQPNFVHTHLGPVDRGSVSHGLNDFSFWKVSIECATVECKIGKMKQETAELKQKLSLSKSCRTRLFCLQGVKNSQLVLLNFILPFFFFFWKGSTFSDAGSDGTQPASCVDIQNRQSSYSCGCPMYGACQNDVFCGLFCSATLAIRCRSKAPFVHERLKTPNTSPQAVEPDP